MKQLRQEGHSSRLTWECASEKINDECPTSEEIVGLEDEVWAVDWLSSFSNVEGRTLVVRCDHCAHPQEVGRPSHDRKII